MPRGPTCWVSWRSDFKQKRLAISDRQTDKQINKPTMCFISIDMMWQIMTNSDTILCYIVIPQVLLGYTLSVAKTILKKHLRYVILYMMSGCKFPQKTFLIGMVTNKKDNYDDWNKFYKSRKHRYICIIHQFIDSDCKSHIGNQHSI